MSEPFFLIGFQRSGTTLIRMLLDSHPQLAVPLDVTGLWRRYYCQLDKYGGLATETDVNRMVGDLLCEERICLWETSLAAADILSRCQVGSFPSVIASFYEAYARAHGKARWGDKDPGNMRRLHLLNEWFPKCQVIHIIRDGRDSCLSQMNQPFGHQQMAGCASAWREEVWWVRCAGRLLGPDRYLEFLYEDLVTNPEAVLSRICEFIGVEYDPQMLTFYRQVDHGIPESKRDIWPLIDKPIQRDAAYRWKDIMSRPQRICFEKRAGDVLNDLGYESLSPEQASGAYFEELKGLAATGLRAIRRKLTGSNCC